MTDFLVLKSGTYHVRLDVPEDAREAFSGRKVLTKSLKTGNRSDAHVLKLRWLQLWKTEIEKARRGEISNFRDDVLQIVEKHQRAINRDKVNGKPANNETQLNFEVIKYVSDKKLSIDLAREAVDIATGCSDYSPKTPFFKSRLDAFYNYELNQRKVDLNTVDRHIKRIKVLDAFLKAEELLLDYEAVGAFLVSKNLAPKTKNQYLFSFNAFYNFLIKKEPSFKDRYPVNPFKNHELSQVRRGTLKDDERRAFTADEVSALYSKAVDKGKRQLADLIEIAAYTGARIEEICRLKTSSVVKEDGVDCFHITEGKTQASVRFVPINPALMKTVNRLVKSSDDGYLLKTSKGGKYETKSKGLGNQFSIFKTELGFDKKCVFHSIRKTVITTLERADVKNLVIISLVGHKADGLLRMTFDRYSEGPTPASKLNAVKYLKYKFVS
ncbi:tyrosine-type recombinase/integrase [Pseudomonas syringae]|uniref:tyrosine-type recombinase/integrase n=1 Tax=Pseudomonas syringae TaxID=317 RepID=UPI001BCEF4B0|nr:tyrosine-type recombinase/integrase [Pseudomonas syringae]MBS7435629.1 tyrosine-type recombinase/integrase [Pseudomonas syringae]